MNGPMDIEQARFNMVRQQIRPWEVLDNDVLKVVEQTPRELFVPEQYRKLAFSDLEVPLPNGQSMMAPKLEARMLQALQIKPDDRILEIGTGSGFVTACLAKMGSHVDTLEWFKDLSSQAQRNVEQLGIDNVSFSRENALQQRVTGHYDIIAVTASMPVYHDVFEKTLAKGGRMFVVTGKAPVMQAQLFTKVDVQGLCCSTLLETCLPPLIGFDEPQTFQL